MAISQDDADVEYVISLVKQKPGEYDDTDLVREFRTYKMNAGEPDPGIMVSRGVVVEAMTRGVEMRDRKFVLNISAGKR